jgi:hypothetical protein
MALPRPWYRGFLQPGNDTAPDSAGAGEGSANTTQPPVLFVHMSRDTHTATGVDEDMQLRNELVSSLRLCSLCARLRGARCAMLRAPQPPLPFTRRHAPTPAPRCHRARRAWSAT